VCCVVKTGNDVVGRDESFQRSSLSFVYTKVIPVPTRLMLFYVIHM
jgi:hypothetical protein